MPTPNAAVGKLLADGGGGATTFRLVVTFFVGIYFLASIVCNFYCISLAQLGWGKFHPINAPTAIQSKISNIIFSLKLTDHLVGAQPSCRPTLAVTTLNYLAVVLNTRGVELCTLYYLLICLNIQRDIE